MVTVSDDVSAVEADLVAGRIGCPRCGGRLRRWGSARPRQVWEGVGARRGAGSVRPRRGRCAGCQATHVLLGVSLAARRADAAAVIAWAVEAKVARGWGHRRIAAALARPTSTVRGWLRSFTASAEAIAVKFMALVVRDAPDAAAVWPAPNRDPAARALAVLAAYGAAVARRFGVGALGWARAAVAATNGWLFSRSWWAGAGQHELALTATPWRRSGSL